MTRAGEWTLRVRTEIKKRRLSLGLGQTALGEVCGRDQPTISRFERGLQSLTLDELAAICGLLGRDLLDLLRGTQPPKSRTDLDDLVDTWPSLTEGTRSSIVTLVRESRRYARARVRAEERVQRVRRVTG